MSGNEPTWSEDEEHEAAGDLYGAPKATPRPGDETTDEVAPMGFVQPLSMDDDDASDAAPAPPATSADAPYDASEPEAISFDASDDAEEAPDAAPSGPLDVQASDDDDDLALGNRPAEGARVVSASEIFSEDFMGAEGASDFLGLDTEFDPTPMAKDAGGSGLELRAASDAVATETDEGGYAPSPISAPEDDPGYAAPEYAGEEYGDGDYADGGLEGDLDGEGFDDELYDDDLLTDAPAPKKRGLLVGAGAFALGLAAVGAALYWPKLTGGDPAPVDVATNGAPAAGGQTPDPAPGGGETVDPSDPAGGETQPRPIEDFVGQPGDPAGGSGPDVTPVGTGGPGDPVDLTPPPVEDVPDVAIDVDPVPPLGAGGGGTDASGTDQSLEDLLAEAAQAGSFYGQNAGMLDLVWRGETVPMEAIFASSRILTPAVGPVRVHMATTDVFEGRLFAVGEEKVWVDMELGRIGLDGGSVQRIERLPREAAVNALDTEELATGHRVRARVPGGVIYGRVRSVVGTSVTLVTESGARITLDDPVLEPVGETKSVVLKL